MKIENYETININGQDYLTVNQFARLTKRDPVTIRRLITEGNRIRKIIVHRHVNKPFIPVEEVWNFPFITAGLNPVIIRFKLLENGQLMPYKEAYEE